MKRWHRALSLVIAIVASLVLAACGAGSKVTYVLPEGATGSAPAAQSFEQYETVTLPEIESTLDGAVQVGWTDPNGNFFANGETFSMGASNITLTASYEAQTIAESYCENPGTMNFGGRLIGPTPAYTIFRADKTWTADAEGVACFSHFEGTWDIDADGMLTMTLTVQDGVERNEAVDIDYDGRSFAYTLTHPGDRGGTKTHVNHIAAYDLIDGLIQAGDTSLTLPEKPSYTLEFEAGTPTLGPDAAAGTTPKASGSTDPVTGKVGEEVMLPECGFSCEGYTFGGWTFDGTTYQAGEAFTVLPLDLTLTATWTQE